MLIELTETQCAELQRLLEGSLADLSTEIADTDNPEYRDCSANAGPSSNRCSSSSTTHQRVGE